MLGQLFQPSEKRAAITLVQFLTRHFWVDPTFFLATLFYEIIWKAATQFVLQETEGAGAENCWHGDETAKNAEHAPKKIKINQ